MSEIWESLLSVCVVLAAAEVIGKLCGENSMVNLVRSLIALALAVSILSGLFSLDLDFTQPRRKTEEKQEELSQYVGDQLEEAARQETENWLQGLLAAAGMKAEKIRAEIDIGEDSSIVLKKVSALFVYESDAERARALFQTTLGDGTEVEVQTDGR